MRTLEPTAQMAFPASDMEDVIEGRKSGRRDRG